MRVSFPITSWRCILAHLIADSHRPPKWGALGVYRTTSCASVLLQPARSHSVHFLNLLQVSYFFIRTNNVFPIVTKKFFRTASWRDESSNGCDTWCCTKIRILVPCELLQWQSTLKVLEKIFQKSSEISCKGKDQQSLAKCPRRLLEEGPLSRLEDLPVIPVVRSTILALQTFHQTTTIWKSPLSNHLRLFHHKSWYFN